MRKQNFYLEMVTPFKILFQETVQHVRVPGIDGYLGILPGHIPLITILKIGEIKVDLDYGTKYFATSGGLIEVLPHQTRLLLETAEEAAFIDIQRAHTARERAKSLLAEKLYEYELEEARIELLKAENRIRVAEKVGYHEVKS